MRGKKEALAKLLFGSGFHCPALPVVGGRDRLLVLAYHRIGEVPPGDYPFQSETISATPEEFERQLVFLKNNFDVVNFHQLAELKKMGKPIPRDQVVVTFDDGYADNHNLALPILQSQGLTATVYVSTGFIDERKPFWFDMLSYYVMRMDEGPLEINRGSFRIDLTDGNRAEARHDIGRAVRAVSDETRLLILDELRQRAGGAPAPEELDFVRPMTWEQIRALHNAGIEIGSHTVSHPFLVQLTDDELLAELRDSKLRIEQETGHRVSSLSYPTGGMEYFDERSTRLAAELGYEFAVSYEHSAVRTSVMDDYSIPRLHVETDVSLPLFKANLLLPGIFAR